MAIAVSQRPVTQWNLLSFRYLRSSIGVKSIKAVLPCDTIYGRTCYRSFSLLSLMCMALPAGNPTTHVVWVFPGVTGIGSRGARVTDWTGESVPSRKWSFPQETPEGSAASSTARFLAHWDHCSAPVSRNCFVLRN